MFIKVNKKIGVLCGLSRSSQEKANNHAEELKHPIGVVTFYDKKRKQYHTKDGRKFTFVAPVQAKSLKALSATSRAFNTTTKVREAFGCRG